jgi:Ni,Fe-hydrogenase I small subunit
MIFGTVYFFFSRKDKINLLYKSLLSLKYQETLRELEKNVSDLERLIVRKEDKKQILSILGYISGQLQYNPTLAKLAQTVVAEIEDIISGKTIISAPMKSSICAKLREISRNLNYSSLFTLTNNIEKK